MKVVVRLPGSSSRYELAQSRLPEVTIVGDAAEPSVEIDGVRKSAWLLERSSSLPSNLRAAVPDGALGLVVGRSLPKEERDQLQDDQMCWLDLRGGIHLRVGTALVHIDRTPTRSVANGSLGETSVPHSSDKKLGPLGTRAAQLMISRPEGVRWSVSGLSKEADISLGQAHNVLARLEDRGLVTAVGRGAGKRRVLENRAALLDWLREGERFLDPPPSTQTFLYARNDMDLARKIEFIAVERGVRHAFTSSIGARMWGAPVTTSVITRIRVDGRDPDVAREQLGLPWLDADEAGRGANIELWSDTGGVGTFDSTRIEGITVAPQPRVWLDLVKQGGRYEDGAEMLRRHILG